MCSGCLYMLYSRVANKTLPVGKSAKSELSVDQIFGCFLTRYNSLYYLQERILRPWLTIFILKQHFQNITFSEPDYEPPINREPLNCQRNLTIDDLCNPCGVSCDQGTCDNWKCSIGCADQGFEQRLFNQTFTGPTSIYFKQKIEMINPNASGLATLKKKHLEHINSNNVDFSKCHTTWSMYSLDLRTVSSENLGTYYGIAIPAMIMNLAVLCCGLVLIWLSGFIQGTYQISNSLIITCS